MVDATKIGVWLVLAVRAALLAACCDLSCLPLQLAAIMFAVRRASAVTARVATAVRPAAQVRAVGAIRFKTDNLDDRRSALENSYFNKEGAWLHWLAQLPSAHGNGRALAACSSRVGRRLCAQMSV